MNTIIHSYLNFLFSCFLRDFCTWLYMKYSYLIQIICMHLYGFKYSYQMLIIKWFQEEEEEVVVVVVVIIIIIIIIILLSKQL